MPHRIHKCTNTLYDYAIINYYVSLMYVLKKNGKLFTSKFVGTGPSSYEKRIYRAAVSQRLRNTCLEGQQRYRSTVSLTSAQDESWWSTPRPGHFTPKETALVRIDQNAVCATGSVWTGAISRNNVSLCTFW